ncbi:guanylate-binding protein 2-like [Carassius auratus]|uniref:Guanylate-binding protein 2-like n=1 Tax=Carassius auratus TaxID=7957 RepID=A0A6P6JSW8_CARAU|nr:guanylate-binding protein 2-like [Carassius auratus]
MSSAGLMSSPICLVENVNGSLSVCKHALEFLSRIKEPVVVVSVVGLYRTGKSYLMNRLAGQQSGFALGSAVESKTKGIWMWCVPHPKKEGHTLVLLDTEGLGDVDKGDSKNDSWIFCLAVLLSSTLVYNSRGTIDNTALENLHYVTELSEQINIRSPLSIPDGAAEGDDCHFVRFFPSFIWVLRDFTLKLEADGKKMTEDEYLEFALDLKKGVNKKISDYHLPRQCIRNYFPSRNCFVFPSPASTENIIHLENLKEQELVPDFLEVTGRFCDHVFNKSPVKTLKGGHRITGKLLGRLVQIYVDTISNGEVPCLDNAVATLAILENEAAVQKAIKVYQSGIEEVRHRTSLKYCDSHTHKIHQKFSNLAISEFIKGSFKDEKGEYLIKLMRAFNNVNRMVLQIITESHYFVFSLYASIKWSEEKEASALLEQRGKEEEEKIIVRERMLQEERKQHAARIQQMQEKFKSEMEQQQQELDRAMESKLKEMEELLMKGFKEKADFLEEEINNLKQEKEEKGSSSFMDVLMVLIRNMEKLLPLMLEFTGKNSKP